MVGTGFAGLAAAVRLKQAGVDELTIFERGDDVGGVWRANDYPGATSDVAAHFYSLSFAPNPDWSREFAPQAEILEYLRRCARDHDLLRHVRFGTEIGAAAWDEDELRWRLTTTTGETHDADVLVAACGQLSRPAVPPIPGLASFRGRAFHSAEWDHGHDLTGRRVAVVGTGASAIQFVPLIAPRTASLHVLQRDAEYVVPKPDFAHAPWVNRLLRRVPATQRALRGAWWAFGEVLNPGLTVHRPGVRQLPARIFRLAFELNLRIGVRDAATRRALRPDYAIGCRRILTSNAWYPTFRRDDVELVTDGIERVTPDGVVTTEGRTVEVDTIVFATGFRSDGFVAPMDVTGRDGLPLTEAWRDGPSAYLGMTVPRFPNLFLLYGPNTNLGGGSVVYMLERQAEYVAQAVGLLRRTGGAALDVRADVHERFDRETQTRLQGSVWAAGGCRSWYRDASGRVTNNWPGLMAEYARRTKTIDPSDYQVTHA
ncbi:MAG: NAD(P)-binding protein [Actinobacteria bacterium]|nr:NAD(P)-binding protein [Actinomycetota bacterium]